MLGEPIVVNLKTGEIVSEPNHPNLSQPKRRLVKIKTKRGSKEEISITYEVENEKAKNGWFSSTFTCNEEARNKLYDLLDETLPILIETVGLDEEKWKPGKVIGLSIKPESEDFGISITGKCEIEIEAGKCYACPTSPYIIAKGETAKLIREIEEESLKYVDGQRQIKQTSLFDEDDCDSN